MPHIFKDGYRFFPEVIKTEEFKSTGYYYWEEEVIPNAAWIVIDPRKFKMEVWRHYEGDFLEAAKKVPGLLVTNGPFFKYELGEFLFQLGLQSFSTYMGVRLLAEAKKNGVPMAGFSLDVFAAMVKKFSGTAVGHVYGEGFSDTEIDAPQLYWFSRSGGTSFSNYEIGQGDAFGKHGVGGLIPVVVNYAVVNKNDNTNSYIYKGLCPLDTNDPRLMEGGLGAALEELYDYEQQHQLQLGELPGLLLVFLSAYSPAFIGGVLAGVLVKDAVHTDGSDSVLFKLNGQVLFGEEMDPHKRLFNKWGFRYIPVG